MIVYALILSDMTVAVDLFISREDAESALAAMLKDEPSWEPIASLQKLDFSGAEQVP